MVVLKKTNPENADFTKLVALLDKDLAIRDGEDHAFYDQFNSTSILKYALVAYFEGEPAGCGAIKPIGREAMEIKRMFVRPKFRGRAIATTILRELELWTRELGYRRCVLETGKRQPEAIALYQKNGYQTIPNYGPYQGILNSVCFEKDVSSTFKTDQHEKN